MAVRVAINGFGRIGRLAFRQMFDAEGYEVVAINDLTSPKMLAHLLKYDTAQGSFCGKIGEGKHTVESTEDSIIVDGKEIKIYAVKDAKDAPWGELNVDVVLECTGFYTSKEKSMAHIQAGAKKVVISAPAGNDLKTIVYSVNEKTLTAEDQVISAASCTTNCLAPMANALNKTFPIVSGIMTTVHAYTGDQMILDGPQRKGDLRRARAGAQNIVPNTTGAAKAIGLVIPELNGKLIGSAQRVPVPTGSTTLLVAVVKGKDVTKEAINAAMKAAASESFGYNEDQIVSSDVIGMRYGSLFDSTQTDGLSSTGAVGDDVLCASTSTAQVALALRTIQDHLVAGVSMNSGHDAGDDGVGLVQGVGHRSQAVGGAGSSRDDLIFLGQGLLVDGVNDGLQVVACRSRDNDLLSASLNVSHALLLAGVEAGALQNDIDVQLAPRSILSVLDSVDLDLLAIDNDGILGSLDGVLVLADLAAEGALSGIVLQQVRGNK